VFKEPYIQYITKVITLDPLDPFFHMKRFLHTHLFSYQNLFHIFSMLIKPEEHNQHQHHQQTIDQKSITLYKKNPRRYHNAEHI